MIAAALLDNLVEQLPAIGELSLGDKLLLPFAVISPVLIAWALWVWHPPQRRRSGAIALATTWNAVWLLAFNVVAVQVRWWSFGDLGPAILGVPLILWLGWVVLWGTAAAQSPYRPSVTLAILAAVDLVFMPLFGDAVVLHSTWLIGEVVLLALVAWPGLVLARWTLDEDHLLGQTLGQVAMFTGMLVFAIPAVAVSATGRGLPLDVPTWAYGAVLFGLGAPSIPAVVAVHDFYINGGTPWPWDSTSRAVRSGPYRYLRSPMQLAGVLVLIWAMFLYGRWEIGIAAAVAFVYSAAFSTLEHDELGERYGNEWTDLATPQRSWLPTWRPSSHGAAASVWINAGCDVCSPIGDFFAVRLPINLEIKNAVEHSDELVRMRYERDDGQSFSGVRAVGASLEHLHFGWAMVGWLLRAPVLWRLWQHVGDAVGLGPRPAAPAVSPAR